MIGQLTGVTPPTPQQRESDWREVYRYFANDEARGYEYARTEMLDAAPTSDAGDYFEEVGYGY